jgi:DNA-binding CsgD family transcriptional regulator
MEYDRGTEDVPFMMTWLREHQDDAMIAILAGVALLSVEDFVGDYRYGASLGHLFVEGGTALVALLGALLLWHQRQEARREAARLVRDLATAQAEARRWEQETRATLTGLGHAISRQFDRWGLSTAEREIAVLLLKGLRHKEIAASRGTSERTVRQQAFTVYRKAGFTSRTELAAFFLDPALVPAVQPEPEAEPEPVSA